MPTKKEQNNAPVCALRRSCGACQTWNLTYEEELSMKMSGLIRTLGKFGHVEEILSMENPYHYRNKLQAVFQAAGNHSFRYGIYQSASCRIIRCDDCLIENKEGAAMVRTVASLLTKMKISAWDTEHHRGVLRHVMVRYATAEDSYMVVLVTGPHPFPAGKKLAEALAEKHPKIKSVMWYQNSTETPLFMEGNGEVLWGEPAITDRLCDCLFRISGRSFYQVNTVMTEKLYRTAISFADIQPDDFVMDAYCGIGTIGIAAAKNSPCAGVTAFDNNENAIEDAKINATLNGLDKISFTCADAGEMAQKLAKSGQKVQVLFADPPRAGCNRDMLTAIGILQPERLVYVSCNPVSLRRDLETLLQKKQYRVQKIQPVDMFPRTTHVETVVLLSKLQNAEHHIEVDLNLDEMDLTSAESKATYISSK